MKKKKKILNKDRVFTYLKKKLTKRYVWYRR